MHLSYRKHLNYLNPKHVAIIWQRFLPYHRARIRQANIALTKLGCCLTAIEVASQDASYGFPDYANNEEFNYICCFSGKSYHKHTAEEIYEKVLNVLMSRQPDVVFAPAIAFPEGVAALTYRLKSKTCAVIMDDAWEHTDRKGFITQFIKRLIYRNAEAVFVPAASHLSYYMGLGFEKKRVIFGVDVVDNEYFSTQAELARHKETALRESFQLPHNYFLFVGRVLPRKGIATLLDAYKKYREIVTGVAWDILLVGAGEYLNSLQSKFSGLSGLRFVGRQFGNDLCQYYGLANALIVPSESDPWGLVVNEGMASGLPVVVSRGCGAAKTLVKEGENGWTFEPGDSDNLANIMVRFSTLPEYERTLMGKKSKEIISLWSLDRFADGVLQALTIPKREPAGIIANILTRLWKGRVRVY